VRTAANDMWAIASFGYADKVKQAVMNEGNQRINWLLPPSQRAKPQDPGFMGTVNNALGSWQQGLGGKADSYLTQAGQWVGNQFGGKK
jgi:hypothetical protein